MPWILLVVPGNKVIAKIEDHKKKKRRRLGSYCSNGLQSVEKATTYSLEP